MTDQESIFRVVLIKGIKSNVEAFSGILDEALIGYATGTSSTELGLYINGDWEWFSSATGTIATGEVVARYTSDAAQSFSSGVQAIINFEDQDYDPNSAVTTGANWKFTCPTNQGGYYHVDAHILTANFANWNAGELVAMEMFKNGSIFAELDRDTMESTTTKRVALQGGTDVDLVPTDYIDVRLTQNSGANMALINNGAYVWISIHKIK